jgi:crossover junction endodeoxyribonuclease RusA
MDEKTPVRELVLVLPLPPSINHQYATVNGRRVLSQAGRTFKAFTAETVATHLDDQPDAEALVALFRRHYLTLSITFYFASPLRRDLDGGLKIAQDALCEALGVNDNLVVEIHLKKRVDRHQPRIEVCLAALPPGHIDLGEGMPYSPEQSRETERASLWSARLTKKSKRRRREPLSLEELTTRYSRSNGQE